MAVLHALNDEQNTKKMGGLIHILPFTYTIILIGSLSLMAIPFLTGFYSKDLIIEASYGQYFLSGSISYFIGTLTAFLTSIYSIKIIVLTFLGTPNGPLSNYKYCHEPLYIMAIPLIILSIFSIFFGYIFKDLFVGLGTDFWINSLYIIPNHINIIDAEFSISELYKVLPFYISLLGILIVIFLYYILSPIYLYNFIFKSKFFKKIIYLLANSYWLDSIYEKLILYSSFNFANITNKIIDKGIIEAIGPYGLTNLFTKININLSKLDNNIIPIYATYIILGLFSFLIIILYLKDFKFILFFISIFFFI